MERFMDPHTQSYNNQSKSRHTRQSTWALVGIFIFLPFCLKSQIITTIAGTGSSGFSGIGGPAVNAKFGFLAGVGSDMHGNIYIADLDYNTVFKIDTNGILSRFAGNGTSGYIGDGGQASVARLDLYVMNGIVADSNSNIYLSCGSTIRKVNASGIITTIAGNGVYGSSGDGGPATAAEFTAITDIYFDKGGNLFIADEQGAKIRRVDLAGIVATVAGTGSIGFSRDGGPATDAMLTQPRGIAVDDSGNIYFSDKLRIRKIDKFGTITTFAGGLLSGPTSCLGCHATSLFLPAPFGIAVDRFENVFIVDAVNTMIYKITQDGFAYHVAGTGINNFFGDGGPAVSAALNNPNMICFDRDGNLIISDKGNIRVRKVWYSTSSVPPVHKGATQLSVFPNPASHGIFTCNIITDTNDDAKLVITNILGQVVLRASCITNTPSSITLNAPPGLYFITAHTSTGKITSKLVVE
jgi:Secretion system C-terminal sorting domain